MIQVGQFLFRFRNYLFPLGLLLIFVPGPPLLDSPFAAALLGLCVALSGQAIRIGTIGLDYIIRGGRERRVYAENLVTSGVYAHSRNPMYVGNLLMITGVCITANSWGCVGTAVPLFLMAYLAITRAEESYLADRFGPAFEDYCRDVPRFLPRLSGLLSTLRDSRFRWQRVLAKEYGAILSWPLRWELVLLWSLGRDGGLKAISATLPLLGIMTAALITFYITVRTLKKRHRLAVD